MFTESIKKINSGNYTNLNGTPECVYSLETLGNLSVFFFPDYVGLANDSNSLKLDYDELAAAAVKKSGTKISVALNNKKISYDVADDEKAEKDEAILKSICKAFSSGSEDSPYENVRIVCEENGIFFDGKYNKYLYHLIFEYADLFKAILENSVLPEECNIEFILQEHTAGLFDDASGTVKNLAGSLLSGNLVGTLFNAGKRIAKSFGNDLIGNNGILVVTDENVVYAKGTDVRLIGETLEEAWDALETERDETIQGAMDIFFEGEKILDNVSGKLWSEYKNTLRRLKNHPKQKYIEDNSDNEDSFANAESQPVENELDSIETKLTQLKRMLDGGLISQEDYEQKKNALLGLTAQAETKPVQEQKKEVVANSESQTIQKAPPLQKKKIENTYAEAQSIKKRGVAMLLCFFFGALGVHRFYCGRIKTGILMALCSVVGVWSSGTKYEDLCLLILFSLVWEIVDFILLATKHFKDGQKCVIL